MYQTGGVRHERNLIDYIPKENITTLEFEFRYGNPLA